MNVSDAIRTKRAVREFQPRPLKEAEILAILNAGRRAQSSKNTQPWQFLAITQRDKLEAFSKLGRYAGHIAGAALAVAILTPDPDSRFNMMFDAGQAAAYMQLAAWEMGIGSCPATIYEYERARSLFGFPADWHMRVAISFGYPVDAGKLSAAPRKGGRQPLAEILHREGW
jgi:nitroreductase